MVLLYSNWSVWGRSATSGLVILLTSDEGDKHNVREVIVDLEPFSDAVADAASAAVLEVQLGELS
jgi:hypothetical protein